MEIVLTHLDEILRRDEDLDRYLALSRLVRTLTDRPLYVTISTRGDLKKGLSVRQRLDPYVDIRGNHGYSFEWWLYKGGSMLSYEQELEAAGVQAWFYHNERGPQYTPEISRVVNGLYLWAGPFRTHAPWVYSRIFGDPFDASDGSQHDMGMVFPTSTGELISTRCWEAMAEGGTDLRRLQTLEALSKSKPGGIGPASIDAQRLLRDLRAWVRSPKRAQPGDRQKAAGFDLSAPVLMSTPAFETGDEAPLVSALARSMNGDGWMRFRDQILDAILAVCEERGHSDEISKRICEVGSLGSVVNGR